MVTKPEKIKKLLETKKTIVAPAAYDALTAKIVEKTGFDAVWVSGATLTNAMLGYADVGAISYGEVRNGINYINNATSLPVLVDVDTGYGGLFNIYRMVQEFQAMGIAGIQIEDQTFPKRCSFFKGVSVVSFEEMKGRLQAVCKARTDPNFLVIARTDAVRTLGFNEALRRAKYFKEIGADMIFISAPSNIKEVEKMLELEIPLCTAVIEDTATGDLSVQELSDMGFKLIKYPQTLVRAVIKVSTEILTELKQTGSTSNHKGKLATSAQRNAITDLELLSSLEEEFLKNTEE